MLLTRPLVLCLILSFLCPRLRGIELSRISARTRLILCLWTATVAEAGMEIACLTTRLGRPLILQEQMFSHSRYLVATTSTFPPLSSLWVRSGVISWIIASVSLLLLLSLVYILVAIGKQFFNPVLGSKGNPSVLQIPSSSSPVFTARPLPWDLRAFRCICSG